MRNSYRNLVNNLVPIYILVFLYSFNVFGLQTSKFGFHNLNNGSLGLHRTNNGIDLIYTKGNIQFKQFKNENKVYSFFVKDMGEKSFVLGEETSTRSSKKIWILFSYENLPRYNSGEVKYIPFCSAKTSFGTYQKVSDNLTKLIDGLENKKIADTFDKGTCGADLVTNDVTGLVKKSIVTTSELFQKCLFEEGPVKEKLKYDDEFSRLMFTYLVNLQSFASIFFSESKILDFKCSDGKVAVLKRTSQLGGQAPAFSIHLPTKLLKDIAETDDDTARKQINNQFSSVITHEISHIFFSIPLVKNANKCEHEYQELISSKCPELRDQFGKKEIKQQKEGGLKPVAIPNCAQLVPTPEVDSRTNPAMIAAQNTATHAITSGNREIGNTPPEGNGVPRKGVDAISGQMDQVTVASARTSNDSPVVNASADAGGEIRQQLSRGEEYQVQKVAASVFSAGKTSNTDIQIIANRVFVEKNAARQREAVQQVAAQLDPLMDAFSKGAVVLNSAIPTAVAATLSAAAVSPNRNVASSSGKAVAPIVTATLSPQQALRAFINGNPGPGETAAAPSTKLAGKISNSGGISAMAAGSSGSVRVAPIATSGNSVVGSNTVSGKMNVAQPSGAVADVQVQSDSNQQNSFQLQGQTSTVQDTAKLRMLSSARAITGNSYVAIKNDYKSKTFVKALAERKILIRVVDPDTRKVKATYGSADSSLLPSRQPSSTGSGVKTKKQSHPDIIFEDNGTSLRRPDN